MRCELTELALRFITSYASWAAFIADIITNVMNLDCLEQANVFCNGRHEPRYMAYVERCCERFRTPLQLTATYPVVASPGGPLFLVSEPLSRSTAPSCASALALQGAPM